MHWIPNYCYYYSTSFGQSFCPSSGVLSRTSGLVHFMQLWPFATRSRMKLLTQLQQMSCVRVTVICVQHKPNFVAWFRGNSIVNIIPPLSRIYLPLHTTFTRRTRGGSLGALEQNNDISNIEWILDRKLSLYV